MPLDYFVDLTTYLQFACCTFWNLYQTKYSYNEQKINKYKNPQNMCKGVSISKEE